MHIHIYILQYVIQKPWTLWNVELPRVRFGPGQREGSHQQPSAAAATEQAAGHGHGCHGCHGRAMAGPWQGHGHADGEVTRDLAKMVL